MRRIEVAAAVVGTRAAGTGAGVVRLVGRARLHRSRRRPRRCKHNGVGIGSDRRLRIGKLLSPIDRHIIAPCGTGRINAHAQDAQAKASRRAEQRVSLLRSQLAQPRGRAAKPANRLVGCSKIHGRHARIRACRECPHEIGSQCNASGALHARGDGRGVRRVESQGRSGRKRRRCSARAVGHRARHSGTARDRQREGGSSDR